MQRIAALVLLLLLLLSGCSIEKESAEPADTETDIYVTIAPLYALTQAVAQSTTNVTLHPLIEPHEMCFRSIELTDRELALLYASADIVISVGNDLEVSQAVLEQLAEEEFSLIEVSEGMDLLCGDNSGDDENSHFSGNNPHFYMSAEKAREAIYTIGASLSLLNEENAELYAANAQKEANRLEEAHKSIQTETQLYTDVPVLVMNETLLYCADEYGLRNTVVIERETGENLSDATELANYVQEGYCIALIERQAPDSLLAMLEDLGIQAVKMNIFSDENNVLTFTEYTEALKNNAVLFAKTCRELRK